MRTTMTAAIAAAFAAALGLTAPTDAACPPLTIEYVINGGRELPDGVPNYGQAWFEPGTEDCAQTAVAMVLGYWDANGWSRVFKGTGPYTGGQRPHPAIDNLVEILKHDLPYSWNRGTTHVPAVINWGPAVSKYVRDQDSGARWTTWDGYVNFDADIVDEVRADRPVVLSLVGIPGKKLTWDAPDGTPRGGRNLNHALTAIGYRQVFKFTEIWPFGCVDWVNPDDRFVVTRSGWRNGGDSTIYYHWGHWDTKTRLVIRPGGTPSGTDWRRAYFFDGGLYSRWDMEADLLDQGYPLAMSFWPGVPNDLDAALNLANGKDYFFKGSQVWRYDFDADRVDPGYPRAISSEWSGVPNDLDAAVRVNKDHGTVYFLKGDKVWTWNIAADGLVSSQPRAITSVFPGLPWTGIDAVVNWGNGHLYVFKGRDYVRFNLMSNRVDPGYPWAISNGWSGLFAGPLDAGLSYASQLYGDGTVSTNAEQFFSFDVGATARTVDVRLTGSGDADLYVRLGVRPNISDWECRPFASNSDETCSLSNVTGRVHVMVRGYASSSDYRLRATWAD